VGARGGNLARPVFGQERQPRNGGFRKTPPVPHGANTRRYRSGSWIAVFDSLSAQL